jgi:hypothetical protein
MKKIVVFILLLVVVASAVAVEDGEVAYVGGTAANVKPGTIGRLDTAQPTSLVFEYSTGKFAIPYATIDSFEYSRERAHDLAVLPIVAVGLFKRLQRQHFVRITYRDEDNSPRAVVFEIPKHMPRAVLAVLEARAPQGCKTSEINQCERRAERLLPNPALAQR